MLGPSAAVLPFQGGRDGASASGSQEDPALAGTQDVPLMALATPSQPEKVDSNAFKAAVAQADKYRMGICHAAEAKEFYKLKSLFHGLSNIRPTAALLKATGIGFLVADKSLWAHAGEEVAARASALHKEWASRVKTAGKDMLKEVAQATQPFGGLKFVDFQQAVSVLINELPTYLEGTTDEVVCHHLAVHLVLNGFRCARHLYGLTTSEVEMVTQSPAQRAMLGRVLLAVNTRWAIKRKRVDASVEQVKEATDDRYAPCINGTKQAENAKSLGDRVQNMDTEQVHQTIEKAFRTFNVPLGVKSLPAATIQALSTAQNQGVPVVDMLAAKASMLRMETKRRSLPAVASALRCWHAFATAVLSYEDGKTLPPRCSADVEAFVAIFKNGNTAANYVGFIRWACTHLNASLEWNSTTLMETVKGARKRHERVHGGAKHAAKLLDDKNIHDVVRMADHMGSPEFSTFSLVCWEFLLRVQSEAVPLLVGNADCATSMPAERHSGLWVDSANFLCLRLARRKNRPQGSLLRRGCTCRTSSKQMCVVHRLQAHLAKRPLAQPVWSFTSASALATLRRMLVLTGTQESTRFTLKAFRAGRATALAAQGKSLGTILQAGEWRSSAFMSYVDTDVVDNSQLLQQTLALSDDEE